MFVFRLTIPCYNAKNKYFQQQKGVIVTLSHEEVREIAELAKLQLTDAEIAQYATQLSDIIGYFDKLQEVDTSQIEPTASVLPLRNVWRPDICADPLAPAQALANAPQVSEQQFVVNAVPGEEEE